MDAKALRYDAALVVTEELEDLRRRIIANHEAAGQKATGATADSIVASVLSDNGSVAGVLSARGFFTALETGSRPWTIQHVRQRKDGSTYPSAPGWFVDIIAEWINEKGIDVSVWGVATKIMKDGSKLYRDGGREDIYTNEIPTTTDKIAERLAGLFDVQIVESIMRGEKNETKKTR